jgi:signal transduction histidine kinase
MLQTILRNLVSNAIKFTPNGGKITIDIKNVNNKIRLQVIDTGVGMDQKTIRSLFSFKEAKSTKGTEGESGSGLGMHLCKEFVSNNKGEIRIESIINKGTTVIIDFPKAK